MTWAHVHPAINHLPVILVPVAAVLLGAAWVRKTTDLKNAGLVVLVAAAMTAGGTYLTGEPAESVIKDLPTISDSAIEEHEDAALLATVVTSVAGILAIGAFVTGRRPGSSAAWIVAATLAMALLAAILLARTANLGGRISHPEIRSAVAVALRAADARELEI